MKETTILQEVNLPNGHIRLIKRESDSKVIGWGSKYSVNVVNREKIGNLDKITVVYDRPFTQEGLEQCIGQYDFYVNKAMEGN